jgi:glycerol-3-phosphate dehydrogenase (NAD(P)+)
MTQTIENIAVIGAGSWGTALAKVLSDKGHRVWLWGHNPDQSNAIQTTRENSKYLPGFPLADNLTATSDLKTAITGQSTIIMAVPSHVTRDVFKQITPLLKPDTIIVSATKGIENDSLVTITQLLTEELHHAGITGHTAVLSGPSFAKEVAQRIPTAVTVAAKTTDIGLFIQNLFFTDRFRVYTSTDLIGLELGGALKNPIAIAAGICDGAGLGTNTRAALITRGLTEITRLGVKMGASPLTFAGLGGLGDLVLTCTGDLSRNRTVGVKLGQGLTLDTILAEMKMVAEGVKTTKSSWNLAQRENVEMPILEQMYQVLYENKPCSDAIEDLLNRDQKDEDEFNK